MKIWAIILQVIGVFSMLLGLSIAIMVIVEGLDPVEPELDIIVIVGYATFGLSLFYNGKFIKNRMQQRQTSNQAVTVKRNNDDPHNNHNLPWEK